MFLATRVARLGNSAAIKLMVPNSELPPAPLLGTHRTAGTTSLLIELVNLRAFKRQVVHQAHGAKDKADYRILHIV